MQIDLDPPDYPERLIRVYPRCVNEHLDIILDQNVTHNATLT